MSSGCWLRCHLIGDTLVRRRQVEHMLAAAIIADFAAGGFNELARAFAESAGTAKGERLRVTFGESLRGVVRGNAGGTQGEDGCDWRPVPFRHARKSPESWPFRQNRRFVYPIVYPRAFFKAKKCKKSLSHRNKCKKRPLTGAKRTSPVFLRWQRSPVFWPSIARRFR